MGTLENQSIPDTRDDDFAKIIRASDGVQVLFYAAATDDGAPQARQVTVIDGMTASLNLEFEDTEEGWGKRDTYLAAACVDLADGVRASVNHMLGRDA